MSDEKETWVEIDPSAPPAQPEVETEKPNTAQTQQEPAKGQEADEGDLGKRAEKRIRQLVGKTKSLEERVAAAEQAATDARREADEIRSKAGKTEEIAFSAVEHAVRERLELAKRAYEEAFQNADVKNVMKAQADWTSAEIELSSIASRPKAPAQADPPKQVQPQTPAAPTQQQVKLPKATEDWVGKNAWFGTGEGKDRVVTNAAIGLSDVLLEEGFDPNSAEFYSELEERLIEEMPKAAKLLGRDVEPRKPTTPVGGQSRVPTKRSNTVRLDQGDLTTARRMGVDNQEFARQRQKAEAAGDDYVTIDITRRK